MPDGINFRIAGVFLQGVVDDRVIRRVGGFFVQQDGGDIRFQDIVDMPLVENGFPLNDYLVSLNGGYFAGVFVHEVFHPRFQHAGGQFSTDNLFQVGFAYFHLFGKVEDFKDIFIAFKTYGAKQSGYR